MNWEKLGNIHSLRPTFQNPNVESMDELGKFSPNLSFTVENKMWNPNKRDWSYFKLKINGIGKNNWEMNLEKYFPFGENGMNALN